MADQNQQTQQNQPKPQAKAAETKPVETKPVTPPAPPPEPVGTTPAPETSTTAPPVVKPEDNATLAELTSLADEMDGDVSSSHTVMHLRLFMAGALTTRAFVLATRMAPSDARQVIDRYVEAGYLTPGWDHAVVAANYKLSPQGLLLCS